MYFKITNENEHHYGIKYKDGLINDIVPFNDNPNDSCCAGGIYFSDEKNILNFLSYGPWIRQIEIPKDAQFVKDNKNLKTKWRADKLFFYPRKSLKEVSTWKWLLEQNVDIRINNDHPLHWASYFNCLDVVKFLIEKGADCTAEQSVAFRSAAVEGHIEIIKFLFEKGAIINLEDEFALRYSAYGGHLEVVKFLVEKGANIHTDNNYPLRWAANNGHLEIVKFLVEKGADYRLIIGREDYRSKELKDYLLSLK